MSHTWPLPWSLQWAGPGGAGPTPTVGWRAEAAVWAVHCSRELFESGVWEGSMSGWAWEETPEVGLNESLQRFKVSGRWTPRPGFTSFLNPRVSGFREHVPPRPSSLLSSLSGSAPTAWLHFPRDEARPRFAALGVCSPRETPRPPPPPPGTSACWKTGPLLADWLLGGILGTEGGKSWGRSVPLGIGIPQETRTP